MTTTNGNGRRKITPPNKDGVPVVTIEPEGEHTLTFTVGITTIGRPTRLVESTARTLSMLLNRGFTTWTLATPDGRQVVYDALADDGEHTDHDEILRIVPEG